MKRTADCDHFVVLQKNKRRIPADGNRARLPVAKFKNEIISRVQRYKTVILVGETGSGKSTQVPQYLFEAGFSSSGKDRRVKLICCTQPRRVATITVSRRVSEETNSILGKLCGYAVRFDDCTSSETRIRYVTDGVLLRETMSDKLFNKYSVIILDEAHERSLQTDFLFGLVRHAQKTRPDLRVIVMSATLDVDPFVAFFQDAAVVKIPGRNFPIKVYNVLEPQDDYVYAALSTCLQIHEDHSSGDVLVFLPGREDIDHLASLLERSFFKIRELMKQNIFSCPEEPKNDTVSQRYLEGLIVKVYAALPQEQQLEVFLPTPHGKRKFILATNIAETSVTIEGVRHIVDCGLVKQPMITSGAGINSLKVTRISKSQAKQRMGRAGREGSGNCYRLYTEDMYDSFNEYTTPEIERVDLSQVLLQLKVIGVEDIQSFDFLSPPPAAALRSSLEILYLLGAVDKTSSITKHGREMAALPLSPMLSNLVLLSTTDSFSCTTEVVAVVSCLSAENIFYTPSDEKERLLARKNHRIFHSSDGDLTCLLNVFLAYANVCGKGDEAAWCRQRHLNAKSLAHATKIKRQLDQLLATKLHVDHKLSCGAERSRFLQCITAGLSLQAAMRHHPKSSTTGRQSIERSAGSRLYRTIRGGDEVSIHPVSCIFQTMPPPKCVVYVEILDTTRKYLKWVSKVDPNWLAEFSPEMFRKRLPNEGSSMHEK